jgi:hypothetical protein
MFGDDQWTDYDFTVDAMRVTGKDSFSLLFRSTSGGHEFEYAVAAAGNRVCNAIARLAGAGGTLRSYNFSLQNQVWYTARVRVRGSRFTCSIYDSSNATETSVFDISDARHRSGRVGLGTSDSAYRFKNIKVSSPDGKLLWEGPPAVPAVAPSLVSRPAQESKRSVTPTARFVPLFNGVDLTGWKTHPRQKGNWRVENGLLVGSGPSAVSHLYSIRPDFKDFHLRVEARINNGGNSGIYFRAPFGPSFPAENPLWLAAYNAKIDAKRLGGLIVDGEIGRPLVRDQVPAFKPGQWITLEVIVEGSRITIAINHAMTAQYVDPSAWYSRGHIVLQQHGAKTNVEFRKIEIKELNVEGH